MPPSTLLDRVARPRGRRSLRSPPRRAERTALLHHRHVPTVTHRGDLAALLAGLALLVVSSLPIDGVAVGGLETDVFRVLNDDLRLPYVPVWVLMQFGSVVAVYACAGVALTYRRYRLTVALLLAGTAAWWAAKAVKAMFDRPRPAEILDGVELRHAPTEGLGFVSGHASVATALAAAAWPWLGRTGRILAVAGVAVVCLARIYVGAHLPLDVVGGIGLGLVVAAVVRFVVTPEPHRPAMAPQPAPAPTPEAEPS
jgi:membrane-associated phospholipid phosphatase